VSQQTSNQSFDELTKGLATGTLSRGKAIRWMGGALLGAALASFPGVAWANDCRRLGRACRRDSQCCSRNCVRRGDDKVCGCPEGQSRCNDRCVNLKRNENHCGSCGNRCEEGQECVEGVCGQACLSNSLSCTDGSQCCSNNCDSGFCLPPTGLTFLTCVCSDSTSFQRCTSLECLGLLFEVCSPLCSSHGGVSSTVCGCDEPPCCSG
jgi:Stigma-specific protein, Stig1